MTSRNNQGHTKASDTVGRNSAIMASGTAASRITGQIRTILLAAAIGTTGIAADAYQTGAMIPQVMFTLISGGIFNAVLVPQIVRTLKEENAEERLNKLITASIVLLLGLTIILMLGTSILTSIYLNSKWNPAQRALANAFTLWCMPQVFFYGLYTVLGQILAAKGKFTAYAWSSVGANIISCAGFIIFICMFGNAQQQSIDFWSTDKVALTAGGWTLGVAFQALVLFIPLIQSGFTYRPMWGLKGIGLRSMGPVAAWSLGVVVVDQLANIVNARITNGAPLEGNPFDIAGNSSYQNAYSLYMLPYSLIAVSVSTAIFPQLSQSIAEGNISEARNALSRALRNVGLLMCFFSVVMLVIPVPIIRALLPSVSVHEAVLISGPLLGLTVGLAAVSAFLLIQRTFYAFEDGKQPFIFAAISNSVQVVIVLFAIRLAPPQHWTALVGLSLALSNIISFPLLVHMLRQRFAGSLDGKRIGQTYAKAIIAGLIAGIIALLLKNPITHLVGAYVSNRDGHMSWIQAIFICVIITIFVGVAYCSVLYLLHTEELIEFFSRILNRFVPSSVNTETDSVLSDISAGLNNQDETIFHQEARTVRSYTEPGASDQMEGALEQIESTTVADADDSTPISIQPSLAHGRKLSGTPQEPGTMRPKVSDIILNRYQLVELLKQSAGLSAWLVDDKVLGRRSQLFIVTDKESVDTVNTAAAALALSPIRRFTPVYQLHTRDGISFIISNLDSGSSIESYLTSPQAPSPSYEAMRTILGESTEALSALYKLGFTSITVAPNIIRLSPSGITIADAPLISMIEPWQIGNKVDTSGSESMVVRQLAGILYALLSGTIPGSSPDLPPKLEALPQDTPNEFRIICMRGLGLKTPDGISPIPLVTLAELSALLGPWTPPEELTDNDIIWPEADQQLSISSANIKEVAPDNILSIPSSIRLNNIKPQTGILEPKWDANQLLFPESNEIEMLNLSGTDTDLFSMLAERSIQNSKPDVTTLSAIKGSTHPTQAVDVSAVRQPMMQVQQASENSLEEDILETTEPSLNIDSMTVYVNMNEKATANPSASTETTSIDTGNQDDEIYFESSQMPPSFSPEHDTNHESPFQNGTWSQDDSLFDLDEESDVSDARLFGHYTTQNIVITVATIITILGIIWASVTISGLWHSGGGRNNDIWTEMSASPLPKENEDNTEKDRTVAHEPKEAGAVPTPRSIPINTIPYRVEKQTFISHPAGQDGMGWYVHLDAPHDVSRVVVSIQQRSGSGQVFANTSNNLAISGLPVADFNFDASGNTEIKFRRPVNTQDIIIWVPTNSLPLEGGLHFNNVTVY